MATIVSTYFSMIAFPHKGRIISIDTVTFFSFDYNVTRTVHLVGEALYSYQHIGVGFLKHPSLMGTFSLPPPLLPISSPSVAYINMISSSMIQDNTWIRPDETDIKYFGDKMMLNPIE